VKPEEVEALTSVPNKDHMGLVGMERQLQTVQDDPDPPECFARVRLRPAQQDGIIRVADQPPQLAATILPEPIKLVEHHIRQHA
jgi:hypothetical protein